MIRAIVTEIKNKTTGINVHAKYDGVLKPVVPYIMVYDAPRIPTGKGQGIGGFYVSYHLQRGRQDDVNTFMNGTITTILHNVILEDSDGNKFRLKDTGELSIPIDNKDNSTSRDRLFTLPKLGAF